MYTLRLQCMNSTAIKSQMNKKPNDHPHFIDGSKDCRDLLMDHLQRVWCSTHINTLSDRKGQLQAFIAGNFLLTFEFEGTDGFTVATCVYMPEEDGYVSNFEANIGALRTEVQEEGRAEISVCANKSVILKQNVSVATLLADEDAEDTLIEFLTTARSARKIIKKRTMVLWNKVISRFKQNE